MFTFAVRQSYQYVGSPALNLSYVLVYYIYAGFTSIDYRFSNCSRYFLYYLHISELFTIQMKFFQNSPGILML